MYPWCTILIDAYFRLDLQMPHMNKGACLNTGSVAYFEKKLEDTDAFSNSLISYSSFGALGFKSRVEPYGSHNNSKKLNRIVPETLKS